MHRRQESHEFLYEGLRKIELSIERLYEMGKIRNASDT